MADFTALKTAIQNAIKQNGNEEITGNILQDVLLAIVSTLGDGSINDLITALGSEATTRSQADGTLQQNIDAEAQARQLADSTLQGGINTAMQAINAINNAIANGCVYAGIATPSSTPASGKVFYLALTAGTYTNYGGLEVPQGINILKNNGSTWLLDSFLGIDDAPIQGSDNLVKSEGVFSSVTSEYLPSQTKTGYYLNTSGQEAATSGAGRQINYYNVVAGDVFIYNRLQGNDSTIAYVLINSQSEIYEKGNIGNDTERTDIICVSHNGLLKVFFINSQIPHIVKVSASFLYNYLFNNINDIREFLNPSAIDKVQEHTLYDSATGELIENYYESWNTVAYIKCLPSINVSAIYESQPANLRFLFYDENKTFISSEIANSVTTPSNCYYFTINTAAYDVSGFTTISNIKNLRFKIGDISIQSALFGVLLDYKKYICTPEHYDAYVTGKFLNKDGDETSTSGANRRIDKFNVTAGEIYLCKKLQGNDSTIGWAITDSNNNVLQKSTQVGNNAIGIDSVDVKYNGILKVFFIDTEPCEVYKISNNAIYEYLYDKTNVQVKLNNIGVVKEYNKFLLSGASMSHKSNGYFELAMSMLNCTYYNASVSATNIMYLANQLYYIPFATNPTDLEGEGYDPNAEMNKAAFEAFRTYDALIISHVHNYNVCNLPSQYEGFTPKNYEDAGMFPYMGNSTLASDYNGCYGELRASEDSSSPYYGLTPDEIYSIGYDYVIKKWMDICYKCKDDVGGEFSSQLGKPCQILLSTHWHDGRTVFCESIRNLALKWNLTLIKYDENVGFTRKRVHPITKEQYSMLYGDTTGMQPYEYIDGVKYGFHPDRGQTKFIQKKFASILYDVLK